MEHIHQPSPELNERRIPRISPESFPLPNRADTFARPLSEADGVKLNQLRSFADLQATAANQMTETLATLESPPTAEDWTTAYDALVHWRSTIQPAQFGQTSIPPNPKSLVIPISDLNPNCDRIGVIGRLRANATWDDQAKLWVGGQPTLSSLIHEQAGVWAMERFAMENNQSDRLHNVVVLPDGNTCNGNFVVRGASAKAIALKLKQGAITRRQDVRQFETGGECIFTVTASEADRRTMFLAGMYQLAALTALPQGSVTSANIAEVAYLLFQAPIMKKGSDAVNRTYLVAAAAYLQGKALTLPQDIDLRAYVAGQDAFMKYMNSAAISL